ncbi:unnamed protein product [Ectocarpus sp. 8 AP-2014]
MSSGRVCHFKLVLLGDTAVGKSCLVVRFVRDEFFEYQEPTIGGKGGRCLSCLPAEEVTNAAPPEDRSVE